MKEERKIFIGIGDGGGINVRNIKQYKFPSSDRMEITVEKGDGETTYMIHDRKLVSAAREVLEEWTS